MSKETKHKRRWRLYKTSTGNSPVMKFLESLTDEDLAEIFAAMDEVEEEGVVAAKFLVDEIYEVKADGLNKTYRLLFAREGHDKHVLLGLVAFAKTTQKTPKTELDLAKRRLADWRQRGETNPEPKRTRRRQKVEG